MLNLILSDYLVDVLEPYVKWISIGLAAILAAMVIALFFAKNQTLKNIFKIYLAAFVVYAFIVTITMLILDVYKHYNAAYLDENYVNGDIIYYVLIPVIITLVLMLASFTALFFLKKKNSLHFKLVSYICLGVCAAALFASLVTIAIYYSNRIDGDGYYTAKGTNFNPIALYASALFLVAVEIFTAFALDKNHTPLSAKEIATAGVCVALAFALSYVKLYKNAAASLTLASTLPIMLFSYFYGTRKGIFVGLIYGLLQSIQNPFIVHPAQFLLDYPIAFSMIGLAGAFKGIKALPHAVRLGLGGMMGGTMRFISSYLSGVFAFGAYAEGQNVYLYSLLNAIILLDALLAVAVGILLTYNKNFRKLMK